MVEFSSKGNALNSESQNSGSCSNCKTLLHGPFCSQCGQKDTEMHRSIWSFVGDFFGDLFSWDSRFIRSFKPLLLKPGFLSREYAEGKRVHYIPPVRMYVLISAIFFLSVTLLSDASGKEQITEIQGNYELFMEQINDALNLPEDKRQELMDNNPVMKKFQALYEQGRLGPFFVDYLNSLSGLMFILMPVFAALLWLLYLRRKTFFMVEHLVFTLHFHSFLFLVSWVFLILPEPPLYQLLYGVVAAVYLYLAMARFYRQSRVKTLLKTGLLLSIYTMAYFFGMAMMMIHKLSRI